jgi:salicylate hydroxylase
MMHRADLHGVLAAAVRALSPDALRLGARIAGSSQSEAGVALRFEDGRTARCNVLVAADGVHSVLRDGLGHSDRPVFTDCLAWLGLVPMRSVADRLQAPAGTNWIGPGAHIITYPVRAGEPLSFVGIVERGDWVPRSIRGHRGGAARRRPVAARGTGGRV